MGKLSIIGNAERTILCDVMEIYLTFSTWESTSALAAERVMQNCDKVLTILQEKDFDISKISLEHYEIKKEKNYDTHQVQFHSERKIKLILSYNMKVLNVFDMWIQKQPYEVNITTNFLVSNLAEIKKEILKEAVNDSREKAELLTETMNQKITGIEEVKIRNSVRPRCKKMEMEEIFSVLDSAPSVSDALSAPEQHEEETVEVVWNIE